MPSSAVALSHARAGSALPAAASATGHPGQDHPRELEGSRALCSLASSCQAPQDD